ncbi:MAG: TRAP transporter small permease subunit [Desulfobacula sp.]|jgi:TRAP-type mannitol/chloroaromatic compound transport system permease small subunit|nr:TRAP transporter small permease subunit [Desulfobacula sp.]
MVLVKQVIGFINTLNEKIGRVLCFSLVVIMLIQVMDVVLRYVFNNPTIWAMDTNTMLFTGASMLAGAYALKHDTHVRLDILYRKLSHKIKTILDMITGLIAMVAICFVIWKGLESFLWAWKMNQHSHSYWAPPMWPVKLCLPLGGILLLLQFISRLLTLFVSLKEPEQEIKESL